jgi:hypothetical protein
VAMGLILSVGWTRKRVVRFVYAQYSLRRLFLLAEEIRYEIGTVAHTVIGIGVRATNVRTQLPQKGGIAPPLAKARWATAVPYAA